MKQKQTIIMVLLFLWAGSAQSHTYSERKKNLEKRTRQLDRVHTAFTNSESDKLMNVLHEKIHELESAQNTGSGKEIVSILNITEEAALRAEMVAAAIMKEKSAELMQIFNQAKDSDQTAIHPGSQKVPPGRERSEKTGEYFKMARSEFQTAEKYYRDKNYFYAIHFFKRSAVYSLKGIDGTGNILSEDFQAAKNWLKK